MKKIPVILALFCISGWSSAALQTVYNPWTGKPDYINSSTGGSGGASGQINSSPQYQIPYYSVAGSSNVLTGSSNFTWNGTSVAVTGNATVSGNVGIGTTAPADKLSVYAGDISVTRPDNTTSQGLYLKTGATYDWGIRSLTGTSDLTFRAEGAAGAVMTLTKVNGNVGIGTAAPGAPLEVQGPYSGSGTLLSMGDNQGTGYNFNFARSSVTGALSIQGEQTGYNNIVLAPTSGNVGIGTTGPTELLSLQSSLPNIKLQITGAGSLVSPLQSGLKFYDYTGTLSGLAGFQYYSYDTLASGYDISTRDTSGAMQHRISVNYQGNVGIGTTSPGEKLQVAGAMGYTFELLTRSMAGSWGTGSKKAVDLIFEEDVWTILGSHNGRNAHLVEQVTAKSQIVFLSVWATDPTLSQAYVPGYFSCVPNDLQQANFFSKG